MGRVVNSTIGLKTTSHANWKSFQISQHKSFSLVLVWQCSTETARTLSIHSKANAFRWFILRLVAMRVWKPRMFQSSKSWACHTHRQLLNNLNYFGGLGDTQRRVHQ